jgi:hypothetical protein
VVTATATATARGLRWLSRGTTTSASERTVDQTGRG